jgi:hypothetical protein
MTIWVEGRQPDLVVEIPHQVTARISHTTDLVCDLNGEIALRPRAIRSLHRRASTAAKRNATGCGSTSALQVRAGCLDSVAGVR